MTEHHAAVALTPAHAILYRGLKAQRLAGADIQARLGLTWHQYRTLAGQCAAAERREDLETAQRRSEMLKQQPQTARSEPATMLGVITRSFDRLRTIQTEIDAIDWAKRERRS